MGGGRLDPAEPGSDLLRSGPPLPAGGRPAAASGKCPTDVVRHPEHVERQTLVEPLTVEVGTLSRPRLLARLESKGVRLNASAETLLDGPAFDEPASQLITVVECSLADLGLTEGAELPRVFEAAQHQGLRLCPIPTGPYLRLAWLSQANAPDSIMSNGRAPTGSLTVAAPLAGADDDDPRGFYLRVVDDELWLRGYHCDLAYAWSAEDRFVFARQSPPYEKS